MLIPFSFTFTVAVLTARSDSNLQLCTGQESGDYQRSLAQCAVTSTVNYGVACYCWFLSVYGGPLQLRTECNGCLRHSAVLRLAVVIGCKIWLF